MHAPVRDPMEVDAPARGPAPAGVSHPAVEPAREPALDSSDEEQGDLQIRPCSICLRCRPRIILLPCGHLLTCEPCSETYGMYRRTCPLC